jgi:hypothetical protein
MTMTLPAPAAEPAARSSGDGILRVVVALVGLVEGFSGLTDLSILFGDIAKIPGFASGGSIIIITIVLHPILGLAALGFGLARRLRYAIAALALLALSQWASVMPSVIQHGLEFDGSAIVVALMVFQVFIQPVIGTTVIAAVWHKRHLAAATVAVMLPTLVDVTGFIAFAISVGLHGF